MTQQKKTYWVYILHCDNDTYYTGYTHDLTKRYQAHLDGTSRCKYTRSFKPLCVAQAWEIDDKHVAMRLERLIKRLSRIQKEQIIANPSKIKTLFHVEHSASKD